MTQPIRLGSMKVIDMNTGMVLETHQQAMTLQPAPPGTCEECAVKHEPDAPHNQQSLYYQMAFHAQHGRWPTWSDAMAHCTPEMQAEWRKHLIHAMKANNLDVPADLLEGTEDTEQGKRRSRRIRASRGMRGDKP